MFYSWFLSKIVKNIFLQRNKKGSTISVVGNRFLSITDDRFFVLELSN